MKIAIPWHPNEIRQFGDEYNITFKNKPGNFDNLMEFLSDHQNERFNIRVDTSEYPFNDYSKFKILNAIHPQVYIVIPMNLQYCEILQENNIKFYFDADFPISNFRTLEYICSLGVSDVYIQDDLCYNLESVKKTTKHFDVQVRMILNQIPSQLPNKGEDVFSPWFIPETVDELAKYIDIAEFVGISWMKLETLYKIWFKQKQWRENLRVINPQLKIDIWNQCMIPDFTIVKMNCGYKCSKGSVCKKCAQFVEMAQDLYNKRIEYVLPKEKEG